MASARGDEAAFRENADRARQRDLSYEHASTLTEGEAQLALWLGRPAEAAAVVRAGLSALDPHEPPDSVAPLCLFGIRAEADLAHQARSERRLHEAEQAVTRAGPLVQRLREVAAAKVLPSWIEAVVSTGHAEAARLRGEPDPELWLSAVADWYRTGRAYPLAWAQWRTAEAILGSGGNRVDAAELVAASRAVGEPLRLQPLLARLRDLVAEHRLRGVLSSAGPTRG